MRSERRLFRAGGVCLAGALLAAWTLGAETATVAVAANFAEPMAQIEADFEAATGHDLVVVVGSTGKLYAQIVHGAAFDVFLAADTERPRRLEENGLAVEGSRFTYAVGRLALWSPDPELLAEDGTVTLRDGSLRRLAIANPDLAPYGAAAIETLRHLGVLDAYDGRIARGENVGQVVAMVASGNADAGFVALASLRGSSFAGKGSHAVVPERLHSPIRQDAVLLRRAADHAAARDFLGHLRSDRVREILRSFGYERDGA